MKLGCTVVLSPSEATGALQESRRRGKHLLQEEQEGHWTLEILPEIVRGRNGRGLAEGHLRQSVGRRGPGARMGFVGKAG